ncbi:MAG: RNA polymerase sigma factor [Candidatus Pacebacteria bacterium]|nr:RNA polymerase sigma factor [Candidatus Paceibacterota bacterium]MCF7862814.1 RNA polymerase sigma factor [Candidatus Paceibacterota bacterium]
MKLSDENLIASYLEGNDKSLSVLIDRYLDDSFRFAMSIVKDEQVAEDIVQESFIKAWKNVRRFIPTNNFRKWLFSIIHNTAIDYLRAKKEIVFSQFENINGENPYINQIKDDAMLPDELLNKAQNMFYMQSVLEEINPKYREVILLKQDNDMTFENIGKILKRPLHTVKSQYRRGIVLVARLLKAQNI